MAACLSDRQNLLELCNRRSTTCHVPVFTGCLGNMLQSIIMEKVKYTDKDEILQILKQHKDEIYRRYCVNEIGLFGSFVRGEATPNSDIDILVEFDRSVGLLTVSSLENYLSDLLGVTTDVVRKRNIKSELKDNILTEVVTI